MNRPRLTAIMGMGMGVGLGLVLTLACRASAGERCICADDCKSGLVCVSGGRQLRDEECIPPAADNDPGECVEDAAGADGDDGGGAPPLFMDLGSKRDFDPGGPVPGTTDTGDSTTGTDTTATSSSSSSTSTSTAGDTSTSTTASPTSSSSSTGM